MPSEIHLSLRSTSYCLLSHCSHCLMRSHCVKAKKKSACRIPSLQAKLYNLSTISLLCPIVLLLPRAPDLPCRTELRATVHRNWLLQVWVDTSHRSELKHFPSYVA